ncbi:ABC transporter permease [Georhizobium profundi]|jgi:peptide/nickel transport system permease protein|uniref:ABC transporter permease n=1 Tax=Georhizobium profundi TaxID=2341112 RepID=A0A3Q8XQI5_9HYPH|nr:ABC transporter permease [Georhizobium profundi]AZN72928.1 ABC transporter permease [Georhizobium profundi]
MLAYILRRTLLSVGIVIVIATALFCAVFLIPGDPVSVALGPRATPEMQAALVQRLGLDQPIHIQLLNFFGNMLTGDLGKDVWSNRDVLDIVLEDLPHTLALLAAGLAWPLALALPLGCLAAVRPGSFADITVSILSVGVIALPSFVVAIILLIVFAVQLKWLPAIGVGSPGDLGSYLRHLILPALAVGLGWLGYFSRIIRASMLEVLNEDHIRTLRAYGVSESRIIFGYALKIAVQPVVAMIGIGVGTLLSGAVFAEIIFSRPGIGKLIYASVLNRNYPVVMGATVVSTALLVTVALIVDLVNAWLDPRSRERL